MLVIHMEYGMRLKSNGYIPWHCGTYAVETEDY